MKAEAGPDLIFYLGDPGCTVLGCSILLDGMSSVIYPTDSELTVEWILGDDLVIGNALTGSHVFGLGDDQLVTLRLLSSWGGQSLASEDSFLVSVRERIEEVLGIPEPPAASLLLIGLAGMWLRRGRRG